MRITRRQLKRIIREAVQDYDKATADSPIRRFKHDDYRDSSAVYANPNTGEGGWTVRVRFDDLSRHERAAFDLAAEKMGLTMLSDDPYYGVVDPQDVDGLVIFVFDEAFDAESFIMDEVEARLGQRPRALQAIEGWRPGMTREWRFGART